MHAVTRRQIEMANRVREFVKAHPSEDPGYAALVTRLDTATARAEALSTQQRDGLIVAGSAIKKQNALSVKLLRTLLLHLSRVGKAAAVKYPQLADRFTVDAKHTPLLTLGTISRAMLDEAKANEPLLREHGLVATLLTDLEEAVTTFEQLAEQRSAGRRAHIGARADLLKLAGEIRTTVDLLDGVHRIRFADTPGELDAWNAAKAIAQPPRRPKPQPQEEADAKPAK